MAELWPHGLPADHLADLGQAVAQRYQKIADRIQTKIRTLANRGWSDEALDQWHVRLDLARELEESVQRALRTVPPERLAHLVTSEAAAGGAAAVSRIFADVPSLRSYSRIDGSSVTSAGLQAVTAIELDLRNAYTNLNARILRDSQDMFQQITSEYASIVTAGVETRRALKREILQKYLSQGVASYEDSAGRHWPIDVYSEMATRTAASRAWREQSVVSMESHGVELFTPVAGRTSCEICGKWQGLVVSRQHAGGSSVTVAHATSGESVQVTVEASLDQMRNDGWGHPNCRCVLIPYIPGSGIEPSDFTTRDPEAEADRAEERRLRRELRNSDDPGRKREIRRELREVRDRMDARKTNYATRSQRVARETPNYESVWQSMKAQADADALARISPEDIEWMRDSPFGDMLGTEKWSTQNRAWQDDFFQKVGIEHSEVLADYFATNDSFNINEYLRAGNPITPKIQELIDATSIWETPESATLYRGLWDMELPGDMSGSLWEDKGYTSTTFSPDRADSWANGIGIGNNNSEGGGSPTIFEITTPKGVKVGLDSRMGEVAFNPGTKIRIVSDTMEERRLVNGPVRVLRGYIEV